MWYSTESKHTSWVTIKGAAEDSSANYSAFGLFLTEYLHIFPNCLESEKKRKDPPGSCNKYLYGSSKIRSEAGSEEPSIVLRGFSFKLKDKEDKEKGIRTAEGDVCVYF